MSPLAFSPGYYDATDTSPVGIRVPIGGGLILRRRVLQEHVFALRVLYLGGDETGRRCTNLCNRGLHELRSH